MKRLIVILGIVLIFAPNAYANLLFFDDFNAGARPEWGNEWGEWVAENGVYDATYKGGRPPTYSSVTSLPDLTDFRVEMDINDIANGGVMLRSADRGNGVLLVTGGAGVEGYEGLYWHIVEDDHPNSRLNLGSFSGLIGTDVHLKIDVVGNTYKAFLNGSPDPLTTLVTDKYSSGKVGLYDYSEQTFDNVAIYDFNENVIPEPASVLLFGFGLCGVFGLRCRQFQNRV